MFNSFTNKNNCEEEAKFLQNRIQDSERYLSDLCNIFGQYTRKTAKIRDKSDKVSKTIQNISKNETINTSLKSGLENFAKSLNELGGYGDLRTKNLEIHVVEELSQFQSKCKKSKDDVRDVFAAREKEIQRQKQLDRIKDRYPRNREQIVQAESDLMTATAELSKTLNNIEEKAIDFEQNKLHDLKKILIDFINIEIGYHARALEVLTTAYSTVESINVDVDLEHFQTARGKLDLDLKRYLHGTEFSTKKSPQKKNSHLTQSTRSLGSLGNFFATTHMERKKLHKDNLHQSVDALTTKKYDESEDSSLESVDSEQSDASESFSSLSSDKRGVKK